MNKYGKSDHFSKTEKKIKNKLKSINNNVAISYLDKEFFIPSNLNNLKENINESKNFTFLSGGTDLALEVTKKRKSIESFIFLGNNNDLKYIKVVDNNILIGGDSSHSQIQIIDIYGNIVYSEKIKLDVVSRYFKLDISMLPIGNYFLNIHSNLGFETIKFIKK